jgi:hypothetical protein
MRRLLLTMLMFIALASVALPAQAHDRWGFSFHSYSPPVPYYAPLPPPPPVYVYPPPWVGYHGPHHHYRYVRPVPPPPLWAPPRSSVSLWFGF